MIEPLYAPDETTHRGGGYETLMDNSQTYTSSTGRTQPVGSRFSTDAAVRQPRTAARRRQSRAGSRTGGGR